MPYFVSRQAYYYSGEKAVEVANGGLDYSGCDMLVSRYPGEGQTYNDPREAVQAAISIRAAWKNANPEEFIGFSYGSNLDMIEGEVTPSDGFSDGGEEYSEEELKIIEQTALEDAIKEMSAWADKEYESLLKCDRCGDIIPDPGTFYYFLDDSFGRFCSENCADNAYDEWARENLEDEEE